MVRRPLIAGNWKMHKTPQETEAFIASFLPVAANSGAVDVLLLPPFTSLDRAGRHLRGSGVLLGAQDVHPEPSGAFTGAISVSMLSSCGCTHVLVGHSERRHQFGESDALVHRKLTAVLEHDLWAVLCVGETLEERRSDRTHAVLERQLKTALEDVPEERLDRLVIAYEPVWAIGTGETASPDQAQRSVAWIRGWMLDRYSRLSSHGIRLLYGGSVHADNAARLLQQPDIDGALVGGAALDVRAFGQILRAAAENPGDPC